MLERVLAAVREAGALSLLDVKRGDIGSTMVGYAGAYLDPASPLAADAITASPYLGFGSLRPLLDAAYEHGRGVFVLALTSNPEGPAVQRLVPPMGGPWPRRSWTRPRRPTRPRAARSGRSAWSSARPWPSTGTGWTTCTGRCSPLASAPRVRGRPTCRRVRPGAALGAAGRVPGGARRRHRIRPGSGPRLTGSRAK